MTDGAAGTCQAPEFPAPSIVDYRPRTTLVDRGASGAEGEVSGHRQSQPHDRSRAAEHRPDASRRWTRSTCACSSTSAAASDPAQRQAEGRLHQELSKYADRFRVFANVELERRRRAGLGREGGRRSRSVVKNGAIGLEDRARASASTRKGRRIAAQGRRPGARSRSGICCARLNIPVIIHTAEPQEFFSPLDMHNERWLELALFADRRNYEPGSPTFEELMGERDRMFTRPIRRRVTSARTSAGTATTWRAPRSSSTSMPNLVLEARRRALRFRPPAARRARVLRQVPGPDSLRQGLVRSRRVPVLLARVRDERRVLRLLPRLPRVLEALRHGSAGRRAEEALLPERAARSRRACRRRGWPR